MQPAWEFLKSHKDEINEFTEGKISFEIRKTLYCTLGDTLASIVGASERKRAAASIFGKKSPPPGELAVLQFQLDVNSSSSTSNTITPEHIAESPVAKTVRKRNLPLRSCRALFGDEKK